MKKPITSASIPSPAIKTEKKNIVPPSSKKEMDWKAIDAYYAYLINKGSSEYEGIPEEVDLRYDKDGNKEDWWDILKQQDSYSCVGWALADLLRWQFVKAGHIEKETKLSARYIWMAAKETDELNSRPTTFIENEGSTIKAALDIVRKYGVVTEDIIPSDNNSIKMYKGTAADFYAIAANLKISSYFNLFDNLDEEHRCQLWKKWIFDGNGPIIARINIDRKLDESNDKKYTFDASDYDEQRFIGCHAVMITGYTKEGYFIIRNTWGESWGNKGYVYISEGYAAKVLSEAYGISILNNRDKIIAVGLVHPRPSPPPGIFGG